MGNTSGVREHSAIGKWGIPSLERLQIDSISEGSVHRYEESGDQRLLCLAFGSNLNPKQIIKRCESTLPEYRAVLQGWRLAFGSEANVATILADKESTAAAVVYSMTADDLRKLDCNEGINGEEWRYARHLATLSNGDKALMYLLLDWVPASEQPFRNYFDTIEEGMQHWLFLDHIERLQEHGCLRQDRPGRNPYKSNVAAMRAALRHGSDMHEKYSGSTAELELPQSRDEQPVSNYASSAYVSVESSPAAIELIEMASRGKGGLFFFHGIFTDADTREECEFSSTAADAELVNFKMRPEGASNVVRQPGGNVAGKLALVPHSKLGRLDGIERAPAWYRREQVNLYLRAETDRGEEAYVCASEQCQFYLMNDNHVTPGTDLDEDSIL